MSKLIMVDPGHYGYDVGNVHNGRREVDYTVKVAKYFGDALARCGFQVMYTRSVGAVYHFPNVATELTERCNFANTHHADLFVSWHNDAASSPDAHGVATYAYTSASATSVKCAQIVVGQIANDCGQLNRGVHKENLAVLRQTNMPAILIEGGFNTNKAESDLLYTPSFQVKQAEAACKAVCALYGVPYKAPIPPQAPTPANPPKMPAPDSYVTRAEVEALIAEAIKNLK